MNDLEKILKHIETASLAECEDISAQAEAECKRIRAEYSVIEQDKYWKHIDAGTKEAQSKGRRLAELAESEAAKQIQATHEELIKEAFAAAANKLRALPEAERAEIIARYKMKPGCDPADLTAKFAAQLTPNVSSMLFD